MSHCFFFSIESMFPLSKNGVYLSNAAALVTFQANHAKENAVNVNVNNCLWDTHARV